MAHGTPIPLTPVLIGLESREFEAVSGWPFADPFVSRLLRNDIPQRIQFGKCRIWIYRDPRERLVGFGTLDVCGECGEYTGEQEHPYIPLLAVNPTIVSQGYGTSIVRHLIDEAALLALQGLCHDVLFLDVYTSSVKAISVYTACGFADITPQPIPDAKEGWKTYIVVAKRVSTIIA